jgi:hypothetical protein
MNNLIRLIDVKDDSIFRGNVLRFPAKYPYEKFVDFMVFRALANETPYGLIVTSGYKAGSISVLLPRESLNKEGGALDRHWIISNWNLWVYPECSVEEVYFMENYDIV